MKNGKIVQISQTIYNLSFLCYGDILCFIALLVVIFGCYFRVVFFPYVQDDYGFAEWFAFTPVRQVLLGAISPKGVLFYRPLSLYYMYGMYSLFGFDSHPIHVISFMIHAINSLILYKICSLITGDRTIGFMTGTVYAVAISIHMDVISWTLSGIQDLGAQMMFFMAFYSFLKGYKPLSSILFSMSLLFKESTIVLPIILFVYAAVTSPKRISFATLADLFLKFWPYMVIVSSYMLIRSFGLSHTLTSGEHPYHIDFWGPHIFDNIMNYLGWMTQVIIPYTGIVNVGWYILLVFAVIGLPFLLSVLTNKKNSFLFPLKKILFLYVWIIIALLPVLFLPNHTYRYYASYSLPAFLLVTFGPIYEFAISYKSKFIEFSGKIFSIILFVTIITSNIIQANQVLRPTLYPQKYLDGTNSLVSQVILYKVILYKIMRRDIMKSIPNLPDNSVMVFEKVNMDPLWIRPALRLWYNNRSIRAFLRNDLGCDEKGYFISSNQQKEYIERSRLFVFRLKGKKLVLINLDNK